MFAALHRLRPAHNSGKAIHRRRRRSIQLSRTCEQRYDTAMSLLVVHVHVHVKPGSVDAFKAATVANAEASRREPGIARFDVVQQTDDPTRFVLVEVYRTATAPAAHKQTAHYATWRDTVAPMMASPRTSVKLANVFPADEAW